MKKTHIIVMAILLAFLVSAQNATALTKSRAVLSPYFQTDADSTYSFVGITHPSLASATSTIGLTVATVGTSSVVSTTFTIASNETYRIFIVATNHSSINNLTVTGVEVIFMATTSGSAQGASLSILSSSSDPATTTVNGGLNNLTQLTMWGAVVIPGTTSGFAMEFVGDGQDSQAVGTDTTLSDGGGENQAAQAGRGIN